MENLSFKAQIRSIGISWVITIPKDFVDAGLLKPDIEYLFVVKENIQTKEEQEEQAQRTTVKEKEVNEDERK